MKTALICIGECKHKELITKVVKTPITEYIINAKDGKQLLSLVNELISNNYRVIVFDEIAPEELLEISLKYKDKAILIALSSTK